MEQETKKESSEGIDISIVIPTYNEKNRVMPTLDAYTNFFDSSGTVYEIIIADYSSDGTKDLIHEYQKKHGNITLLDINKRGKGLAVYEAFKICKGRYLSFTDADNATPPEEFYKLYRFLPEYDAAIGSRGIDRTHVTSYHQSPLRRLGSLFLGVFFVRFLYGLDVKDSQCGAKIFKGEIIQRILPYMRITNSIFDIELLWRFKKVGTIKEVPVNWVDDRFTHFKWKDTIKEFGWLLRVRFGL
jgi:glycosyltransferase involved in cell wall biosynthesis